MTGEIHDRIDPLWESMRCGDIALLGMYFVELTIRFDVQPVNTAGWKLVAIDCKAINACNAGYQQRTKKRTKSRGDFHLLRSLGDKF